MSDFLNEYRSQVRKRLSSKETAPFLRVAELLCYPSFDPETLLRVVEHGEETIIRLMTFDSQYWSGPGNSARLSESKPSTASRATRFWTELENLEPASIEAETSLGLDGMWINCLYRIGDETLAFDTWSPDPHSPPGRFVRLIYDLARDTLQERHSIERLEQMLAYLRE